MGRPVGAVNWSTLQIRLFCQEVIADPEYRRKFLERARKGQLGTMEQVCWAYAYGLPPQHLSVDVSPRDELAQLSMGELVQRAEHILKELRDAEETQRVLDGEVVLQAQAQLPASEDAVDREDDRS